MLRRAFSALGGWPPRLVPRSALRWSARSSTEDAAFARGASSSTGPTHPNPAWIAEWTEGVPGVFVGWTEGSGRGLYASRAMRAGEVVHRATPLVAHPTLANLSGVCYDCLGRLPAGGGRQRGEKVPTRAGEVVVAGTEGQFCTEKCAASAWERYHAVETAAGQAMAPLVRYCLERGLKFPLVVARLACMVISGAVDAKAADPLCHVNFPEGVAPGDWLEEHAMLRVALTRGLAMRRAMLPPDVHARLERITPEWYVGITSRLHLNAFRCEVLPAAVETSVGAWRDAPSHSHGGVNCTHDHGHGHSPSAPSHSHGGVDCTHDHGHSHSPSAPPTNDFRAAMEAALASSAAGVGTGSGLYTLPSLLNHSCDPNVDATWEDGDATLTLTCRADVASGEELTITYIDADSPVDARRQRLHHAYGFTCMCARCVEEAGEA